MSKISNLLQFAQTSQVQVVLNIADLMEFAEEIIQRTVESMVQLSAQTNAEQVYLTTAQIVETYDVSESTINRRAKAGLLHPVQEGNKNCYLLSEVKQQFVAKAPHLLTNNKSKGYEPK